MRAITILLRLVAFAPFTVFAIEYPARTALATLNTEGGGMEAYDIFKANDRAAVSNLLQEVQSTEHDLVAQTPEKRNLQGFGNREAKAGGLCFTNNGCPEDFSCTSGRCIPSPDSCLGEAIADHLVGFDSEAWIAEAMKEAGVTKESLMTAGRAFKDIHAVQKSLPFQKLAAALEARPAPEIILLKESVDSCTEEKQDYCTIFYHGINFEISGLADIAAAVLWAYGINGAVGFVRGSFGLEIGIPGGDISYTFGFAFTCDTSDTSDIATGGIIVDVDAGVGPNVGFATVAGFNGANSIEITIGGGFGLGILGVGYSITATLDPTQAPTFSPTPAPTPNPTPGGGGDGGPGVIADFGCDCVTNADCATSTSTCKSGASGTNENGATAGPITCTDKYCGPASKTPVDSCGCQVDLDCLGAPGVSGGPIFCTSSGACHSATGGKCVCFPGDALVEEESKGFVEVKDLAVGDKILTSSGFSQVYGFGHGLKQVGEFIRLTTGPFEPAIELTSFHQVFVGSKMSTKYAKDVQVGDLLILKNMTLPVTAIEIVHKQGLCNPYTLDGTMFVNGVLASAFSHSSHVAIGSMELVSKHKLKYMVHAPTRMLCTSTFASYTVLCSHDEDLKIGAATLVDSAMFKLVPGVMQDSVNYLSLDSLLPIRLVLLLLWILPMYWLEQKGGLVALISAALGGWILYKTTKSNKRG